MHRNAQAGVALATAIFLIVVLAGLGAIALTVSGLQHTSSARDVMGAKAYQAARSGLEWGAHKVLQQAAAPGSGRVSGRHADLRCRPAQISRA